MEKKKNVSLVIQDSEGAIYGRVTVDGNQNDYLLVETNSKESTVKKTKKIGVSFKNVKDVRYCYVNYDKKSTRFVYLNQEDDINLVAEADVIERIVRYLTQYSKNFTLKDVSSKILLLWFPLVDNYRPKIVNELGNILSYNQYINIDPGVTNSSSQYQWLLDFLDERYLSISDEIKLPKSILELISPEIVEDYFDFILLHQFTLKYRIHLIDWFISYDLIQKVFSNFIQNNQIDFSEFNFSYKKNSYSKKGIESRMLRIVNQMEREIKKTLQI